MRLSQSPTPSAIATGAGVILGTAGQAAAFTNFNRQILEVVINWFEELKRRAPTK